MFGDLPNSTEWDGVDLDPSVKALLLPLPPTGQSTLRKWVVSPVNFRREVIRKQELKCLKNHKVQPVHLLEKS